jgi:AraC-like DNA-binding protein
MYPWMSIVRGPRPEPPARTVAAYHVVLPPADASLEIATVSDGSRTTADPVSALFVGPLTIGGLMSRARVVDRSIDDATANAACTGCCPLVITLAAPMLNSWSSLLGDGLIDRPRVLRQTIVMSASTLLLAHRLRLQLAGCARPASSSFISIDGDYDRATPFLDELFGDFLAVDPTLLFRRGSSRRRALVDRARRVLAGSPGSSHRLTDLAETLGVSAFHFARVFRAETTLSVHQYLLRLRMARALQRLTSSDVDLSRLALEIGFSSHSHFSAMFHKQFGTSPAQVRNSLERERRNTVRRSSTHATGRVVG